MQSTRFSFLTIPLAVAVAAAVVMLPQTQAQEQKGAAKKGTFEKIKVYGKALEGNLEGDSPDRDVFVYVPPSYGSEPNRRFPVVYFLHGYGIGAEQYWNIMTVPDAADKGGSREMILVHPDANTIYNGSMYSNSPTTGDWEAYVTEDLVGYIDSHYRTVADRGSRGLAGHSMGGYGTIRIGMKHPEVFSALYAMSSCCLMNNPQPPGQGKQAAAPKQVADNAKGDGKAKGKGKGGFGNVNSAQAAAWSPNPMNPPQYFDPVVKDGEFQPIIAAKWVANSPLAMVDQYVPSLKKYKAIAMDVGVQDGLITGNRDLDQSLTRLGIPHTFEIYEGDHNNRVRERFETKLLPFFSQNLTFPAAGGKKGK